MSSGSPFKKFKADNPGYAGFRNMNNMKPNKAYRIYKIEPSNHVEWGPGELAYVNTNTLGHQIGALDRFISHSVLHPSGRSWKQRRRSGLIEVNKFSYLVFRGVLEDDPYKLDVIEDCDEIRRFHMSWRDVPAVEEEVEDEPDDVAAANGVAQANANGDANGHDQPLVNNPDQPSKDPPSQEGK